MNEQIWDKFLTERDKAAFAARELHLASDRCYL